MRNRPTDKQLDWIRQNYLTHTKVEMMSRLKVTEYMLNRVMAEMGLVKPYLRKNKPARKVVPPPVPRVIYSPRVILDPPKKPFVRPPAVYTNRSQQQVIDYYLNMQL